MGAGKALKDGRQVEMGEGRQAGERQGLLLRLGLHLHCAVGRRKRLKVPPRHRQQLLPRLGQRHFAGGSQQQAHPNVRLKLANPVAEGSLRQIEVIRGAGKGAQLRNGNEGLQSDIVDPGGHGPVTGLPLLNTARSSQPEGVKSPTFAP